MNIRGSNNVFPHFISYNNFDANDSPAGGNADGMSIYSRRLQPHRATA